MKGAAGFAWTVARRRPFSVLVQVTNRCNMKCPFCDFWPNGAPTRELSLVEHTKLATDLAGVGTFLVSLEGGEPFVRPDLVDLVAAYAAPGHLPLLYTNGWFVDAARAAALGRAGVHQVGVSIDFPDATRHDAMRRATGAFEKALRAVEYLAAALGPRRVHVMTVLMRQNQDELDAMFALSARLGVGHQVTLLSDLGFRRGKLEDATRPDADALARMPRPAHLTSFRSYLDGLPRFLGGGELPRCHAGIQSFNVDHVGDVAACIETIDRPVGNVRDTPIAELLARLAERDTGKGCQACWTLCRGTAQALGGGGTVRDWVDLGRM